MFDFVEKIMSEIIRIINGLGYWGIAGGMAIESACIPLPSEVVLPLAGNMAANGHITMIGANIAVALGSLFGSLLAYFAGYYGGRPFILKYGKFLLISKDHFFKAEKTFNKYGGAAVFFGRLLPVIRTFISLPAGMAKYDIRKFVVYSLAGMIPWNFILIWFGFNFVKTYETVIRPIFKQFEYVILVLIVLSVLFLFIRHAARRRRPKTYND